MKGWAAAIMRIWLEVARKRLPSRPQGLAQSNTGEMLVFQARRALDGHGAAAIEVRRFVLGLGKADLRQEVELEIGELFFRDPEHVPAEILAERVGVERVFDVEGARQLLLEPLQDLRREALGLERLVIDLRCVLQGAAADRIADDVFDLIRRIAKRRQRARHHAVDDLEVTAAGQFLELHQGEIGLDAGGVAIHHQADRAGRGDHRGLSVAVSRGLRRAPARRSQAASAASTRSRQSTCALSSGTGRTESAS